MIIDRQAFRESRPSSGIEPGPMKRHNQKERKRIGENGTKTGELKHSRTRTTPSLPFLSHYTINFRKAMRRRQQCKSTSHTETSAPRRIEISIGGHRIFPSVSFFFFVCSVLNTCKGQMTNDILMPPRIVMIPGERIYATKLHRTRYVCGKRVNG